jgi:hypothetical protein
MNKIETITPAYQVGDRVRFGHYGTGTIEAIYAASGVPQWLGTRRVLYTHCYHFKSDNGVNVYGLVDGELSKAQWP